MSYMKNIVISFLLGLPAVCFAARDQDVVASSCQLVSQASDHILANQDLSLYAREKLDKANDKVNASKNTAFTEEELISAMSVVIESFGTQITPEMQKSIVAAQEGLIKRLRNFNIIGFSLAVDPNGAFFVDTQDPEFDIIFKNYAGEIKSRKVKADIKSIGLKIEFALNVNIIFFVGTDLNYLDTIDKIDLGVGFEFGGPGLRLLYAPFNKIAGGMLMGTLNIGLSSGSLSVVTGGSLTPVSK